MRLYEFDNTDLRVLPTDPPQRPNQPPQEPSEQNDWTRMIDSLTRLGFDGSDIRNRIADLRSRNPEYSAKEVADLLFDQLKRERQRLARPGEVYIPPNGTEWY